MLKRLEQDDTLQAVLENPFLLMAERCRRDFYTFVKEFWSSIIEEEPVFNWHIKYLCKEMQKIGFDVLQKKEKKHDLLINIPPGTTKSTICTVMFPAWIWIARIPGKEKTGSFARFITGSFKAEISLEHAELSRDIINSDKYKLYFPELEIRKDKNAKSNYKNTDGGYRTTTSVGTSPMGKHAHFIIIDDPIDPEQTLSDPERESANRWVDNITTTRKVDKKVTVTVMIMQRLHKLDPSGHWLTKKDKKIRHIQLPGILKIGDVQYAVRPKKLKKKYIDGLLDPKRMSASVMIEMRSGLGPYGFSAQIGQDPRDLEDGMFLRSYFEIVEASPAGGTQSVRAWDLAATSEKEAKTKKIHAAYTAGVKMKECDGIYYIEDVVRKRVSDPRGIMKNTASQDGTETMIDYPQDPGSAGKVQARDIAKHLAGYDCRSSLESGDKIVRILPFSAQCRIGNVKLVRGAWNAEFLEEGDFFPNGFKDQFDAAGRAFNRTVLLSKQAKLTNDDYVPNKIENKLHQIPEGDYY